MEASQGRQGGVWRIARVDLVRDDGLVHLLLARVEPARGEAFIELVQTSSEAEALLAQLCVALRSIAQAHASEERAQRILARESRIAAAMWAQQALAAARSLSDVGVVVDEGIDASALFVSLYTGGAERLFFRLRYDEALEWITALSHGLARQVVDGRSG